MFQSAAAPMMTDFQSELANRLGVQPAPEASESPAAEPGEGEREEGEGRRPSKNKRRSHSKKKKGGSRSRTSSKISHGSKRSGGESPLLIDSLA